MESGTSEDPILGVTPGKPEAETTDEAPAASTTAGSDQAAREREELHQWLLDQLDAERVEVNRRLESRHANLVLQLDVRLQSWARQVLAPSEMQGPTRLCPPEEPGIAANHLAEEEEVADCQGGEANAAPPSHKPGESFLRHHATMATMASPLTKVNLSPDKKNRLVEREETDFSTANKLKMFVTSSLFEVFFAALIICNALIMAAQTQYVGMDTGFALGFRSTTLTAEEEWPGAADVFMISEVIFGICFTIEVCVKVVCLRIEFLHSFWNWLDAVIVIFWLVDRAVNTGFNPTMLRLFRIAKLIRIVRLIRSLGDMMHSLNLMMAALKASLSVGFWALLLLGIIQCAAAMFMSQVLEGYILDDENHSLADRTAVFMTFGTFTRAVVSMFIVTLANWAPACQLLFEKVSEWWGVFFLVYKVVVGYAVLNVINGVFLHETFKVATHDDDIMIAQKQQQNQMYVAKLQALFDEADESGDGKLSWEEFECVLSQNRVASYLAALELEVTELKNLFMVLDDGDGNICFEEFLSGIKRTKGPAKALDMSRLLRDTARQTECLQSLEQRVSKIGRLLEAQTKTTI